MKNSWRPPPQPIVPVATSGFPPVTNSSIIPASFSQPPPSLPTPPGISAPAVPSFSQPQQPPRQLPPQISSPIQTPFPQTQQPPRRLPPPVSSSIPTSFAQHPPARPSLTGVASPAISSLFPPRIPAAAPIPSFSQPPPSMSSPPARLGIIPSFSQPPPGRPPHPLGVQWPNVFSIPTNQLLRTPPPPLPFRRGMSYAGPPTFAALPWPGSRMPPGFPVQGMATWGNCPTAGNTIPAGAQMSSAALADPNVTDQRQLLGQDGDKRNRQLSKTDEEHRRCSSRQRKRSPNRSRHSREDGQRRHHHSSRRHEHDQDRRPHHRSGGEYSKSSRRSRPSSVSPLRRESSSERYSSRRRHGHLRPTFMHDSPIKEVSRRSPKKEVESPHHRYYSKQTPRGHSKLSKEGDSLSPAHKRGDSPVYRISRQSPNKEVESPLTSRMQSAKLDSPTREISRKSPKKEVEGQLLSLGEGSKCSSPTEEVPGERLNKVLENQPVSGRRSSKRDSSRRKRSRLSPKKEVKSRLLLARRQSSKTSSRGLRTHSNREVSKKLTDDAHKPQMQILSEIPPHETGEHQNGGDARINDSKNVAESLTQDKAVPEGEVGQPHQSSSQDVTSVKQSSGSSTTTSSKIKRRSLSSGRSTTATSSRLKRKSVSLSRSTTATSSRLKQKGSGLHQYPRRDSWRHLRSPRYRSRSPERKRDKATRKLKLKTGEASSRKNSKESRRSLSPEFSEEQDLTKQLEQETSIWTRCSPADLYYQQHPENQKIMVATPKLTALHERFESELLQRANKIRNSKPNQDAMAQQNPKSRTIKILRMGSDTDSSEQDSSDEDDNAVEELERKRQHPDRLHEELWFNDSGEMNDGPLCRCSARARRSGIRHGIYPGESGLIKCTPTTNNADRLYHYRITMSPHTNFLTKTPTIVKHDGHEFIFEGFSLFAHYKLDKLPTCKVIRFNIEYTILYIEEKLPENFTVQCLELFSNFLFNEVLELVDLDLRAHDDAEGCNRFHLMPRFVRALEDNGKEILSMNDVLTYLLNSSSTLVEENKLSGLLKMTQNEWQNFADEVKGMIATYPGMKPCSIRVDQLDRDQINKTETRYPEIVHFGIRPLQLSYAGNPNYQRAWREYVKFRHLLANKPKVSYQDRHKLTSKEMRLQEMRTKSNLKRDVTVVVSSKGFYRTGIMCDVVQHSMLIPVLVCHLRFHKSLDILEESIGHQFEDRYLLQLALTHPSYRENFGTNPDHARNSLTNCGIRQPEYGDRRIHYMNTRKRGINTLINIMSRFGKRQETVSNINHNERLEFLGDAVVEFLTSIHLYHLFPDIEEGGLATYRAAIVQNQHLAVLAKKLQLEKYMLYAHGSDLCHDLELRHAMANCLEALMGALFLDGGIEAADRVFSHTLFSEEDLLEIWLNYPLHPLQEQEPDGDRTYIESVPLLQKLTKFEDAIGVEFFHIRLLARAFTHRSVGFNNLTLGSNQRLEFLGDTVLQLVASEYLYKFFPEHHEGHLSLLRSSLVNNKTQSVVCDDLGMVDYAIYAYPKGELKTKDRADLLEAFLGALYVDQGLEHCRIFCQVCFFPRLQDFIMNQDWNDPKSKLQQCCLTLRTMEGGEPDIPVYKVIECKGPTNTRIFTVAVYFRGERLAKGSGHSIQQAEMAAASKALVSSKDRYQVKYSTNPLFVLLSKQSSFYNLRLRSKNDDAAEMSD